MRRLVGILIPIVLLVGSARAEEAPAAASLLFEKPQWSAAAPGTTITYRYSFKTGLESVFGPAVEDRIRLSLDPGTQPETRTVRVDMFSESRHTPAGPFEDVPGNPALVLFLEHHLESLAKVLKANPRYLKNGIRAGLRDKADVTATTVDIGGRTLPAWRVVAKPFADDPNRVRMRGLDSLTYTFVTADAVPGGLVSMEARAVDSDGATLLVESLTHDPR